METLPNFWRLHGLDAEELAQNTLSDRSNDHLVDGYLWRLRDRIGAGRGDEKKIDGALTVPQCPH
jgi:hypothetical protein